VEDTREILAVMDRNFWQERVLQVGFEVPEPLRAICERNKALQIETQQAALALLGAARILFLPLYKASPPPATRPPHDIHLHLFRSTPPTLSFYIPNRFLRHPTLPCTPLPFTPPFINPSRVPHVQNIPPARPPFLPLLLPHESHPTHRPLPLHPRLSLSSRTTLFSSFSNSCPLPRSPSVSTARSVDSLAIAKPSRPNGPAPDEAS
jgi:hypothetical protein